MATFFGPTLAAIVAATSTIAALVIFLRFWKPKRAINPMERTYRAGRDGALSTRRQDIQGMDAVAGLECCGLYLGHSTVLEVDGLR